MISGCSSTNYVSNNYDDGIYHQPKVEQQTASNQNPAQGEESFSLNSIAEPENNETVTTNPNANQNQSPADYSTGEYDNQDVQYYDNNSGGDVIVNNNYYNSPTLRYPGYNNGFLLE